MHKSCHCCGLIHMIPELATGQRAVCTRCQSTITRPGAGQRSSARTVAAAVGAFCLYWPAILLPILQVERHGHRSESSILAGTLDLVSDGSWFTGGVIFLFSVVLPLTKIVLLIELSLLNLLHRKHRSLTFRIMEYAGKWSMMDVMLLALLVMLVKLGNLVHFEFGPAVIAFVLCVTMSLLASMSFDPHSIWSENE